MEMFSSSLKLAATLLLAALCTSYGRPHNSTDSNITFSTRDHKGMQSLLAKLKNGSISQPSGDLVANGIVGAIEMLQKSVIAMQSTLTKGLNSLNKSQDTSKRVISQDIVNIKNLMNTDISSLKTLVNTEIHKLKEGQSALKDEVSNVANAQTRTIINRQDALKNDVHGIKDILTEEIIRFPNPVFGEATSGHYYVQGHVEILHSKVWGTICDDGFDASTTYGNNGANVLCKMGGYSTGVYNRGAYKQQSASKASKIWLDDVECGSSSYNNIDECSHASWGTNNCNHNEDVGIRCYY